MAQKIDTNKLEVRGSSDEKSRLILACLLTVQNFVDWGRYPPPPYSKFERTDSHSTVKDFLTFAKDEEFILSGLIAYLNQVSKDELVLIQGMRLTEGSIMKNPIFPDLELLVKIANKPYNEYLSHIARARSKHSYRCPVDYWGSIEGSPEIQNKVAIYYLNQLFSSFTWWNRFSHFKHEEIVEFRDPSGHGMRWDISSNTFIGFVEPVDPNLGQIFRTELNQD